MNVSTSQRGMVYLVGAGPGDYRLITLKGLECIKLAEVIVYDRLADDRLLTYARPDAELIYVGKASGEHSMKQEDINRLLAAKAKAGKVVTRLKGGDPLVFGRGGEEALHLMENGIVFEFVPGVTSAIAAPAYAGIPVTHRGIATSFAVVTGHEDPAKSESGIRWDKLAEGVNTLVFLMGVEHLAEISAKLMEHGRSADTPAAIIRWGTKPGQQVWLTTLAQAAADAAKYRVQPPAVFLVGDVVTLRQKLAWFDTRPLFGKKILVTRAREQASLLTARLESLGAECIEAPAIRVIPPESYQPVDAAIEQIHCFDWLIFTSVNGVDAFFARLRGQNKDARALASAKVAAIGAATAARLKEHGIFADIIPAEFRAEGIIEAIAPLIQPGMRVLIPRALAARDILPEKLAELGAQVDVAPVYRTVTGEADRDMLENILAAGAIDIVTFTSSSTVTNILTVLGERGPELLNKTTVACIGPVTAGTCKDHGIHRDIIAEEFTINGLVAAILQHYTKACGREHNG